ncbi:hypothetical protein N7448_007350 [Penicillium atrosanguineum]|uniref:Uncharacterized protein n=1 Tax=Penicillium atrosanguineum TaxID=1132637 RepID=A0A9W9UE06_9EURO|nr:uncharacterized protein N7443_001623 [Penicillium atrosanguineum]KAJ5126571.1 hypothetical protein N7448_007350 [Penicillium atrosanguineum]KAJ5146771.1 hypothetical protein N7526_000123 [Penicillium atrosanguineum]KAJ5314739.1 hypothetical protein N7443_001623 [Penicillium atrosanguineum]KAJ5331909.1 hypothetical protein N7476_001692 [Penicillium atrosanguineum]
MSPDTLDLAGKVAIVTGSGRETGIGACIASTLARNGALVIINHVSDASSPRATNVMEDICRQGGRAAVVKADVTTPEGAKALINETLLVFGVDHIDILVNNAAAGMPHGVPNATRESVDTLFSSIVYAPIFLVQAAVPYMPRGSRVINIGSIASKLGMAPIAIYGAAKAAADALTYSMAMELGRSRGITINTVSPGPVDTDALPKEQAEIINRTLVPMTRAEERVGTTHDIADAVLLLVSEKSRWITGQVISVSGGITGG